LAPAGAANRQTHKQARIFHRAIAVSRLRFIEGAGHMLNMDQPDRFNAELKDFLTASDHRESGHERSE
jgi:pimeloyl-ACP methyl ester carboxylesterase